MAKAGFTCLVRRAGLSTAVSSEAFTSLGSDQYQITSAARRAIDVSTAWHLRDTGGTVPWASITAADFGFGEFTVTGASGALTFYGSYLPLTTDADVIAEAKSFSLSESRDLLDSTVFTSTRGFRTRIAGLQDVSISVDLNLNGTDMPTLSSLLFSGALTVFEINSGVSALFRAYGRVVSIERSAAVDGLVEASVEWNLSAEQHAETGLSAAPSDRMLNS